MKHFYRVVLSCMAAGFSMAGGAAALHSAVLSLPQPAAQVVIETVTATPTPPQTTAPVTHAKSGASAKKVN